MCAPSFIQHKVQSTDQKKASSRNVIRTAERSVNHWTENTAFVLCDGDGLHVETRTLTYALTQQYASTFRAFRLVDSF